MYRSVCVCIYRFIISLGSGISFIINIYLSKYGYNNKFLRLHVTNSEFNKSVIYVLIGVFIEFIIYLLINFLLILYKNIEIIKYWNYLIKNNYLYIVYMILIFQPHLYSR